MTTAPTQFYLGFPRKEVVVASHYHMFRAVGFLIILWGLSLYFGSTIKAFDRAATATFETVEVAALVSQARMQDR